MNETVCFEYRYDHPDILAGQGTAGLEILEDIPDVDYIIVPVGGGGLIAGVSAAVKHLNPNVQIIVSIMCVRSTDSDVVHAVILGNISIQHSS